MIVDTSALVAILFREPERPSMLDATSRAENVRIGAPDGLELCMVVDRRNRPEASAEAASILRQLTIAVVPFGNELVGLGREPSQRFGKGLGHPARLNYGDCMAYALAKHTEQSLLFKGNDFTHTDITPTLNPPAPQPHA